MQSQVVLLIVLVTVAVVQCGNNGLARKPLMGCMSWLKDACTVERKTDPDDCIYVHLYKSMVDHLAKDGYLELGYNTVNIDDCWEEMARDPATNRLVADKRRFPNGIESLVKYAHSKKVLFGIYEDVGT